MDRLLGVYQELAEQGVSLFTWDIGEEKAAQSFTGACPFSDVPAWAPRYVAYAYAKGYTAVCVAGVTTGFGKASSGRLKNRYPKGLRNL